MPSPSSVARSITRRSTGGMPSGLPMPGAPVRTSSATSPASRTSGSSAMIHGTPEPPRAVSGATRASAGAFAGAGPVSGITAAPHGFEEAHPPQLGEFALVRVEHELAGVPEPRLEHRTLRLAQR